MKILAGVTIRIRKTTCCIFSRLGEYAASSGRYCVYVIQRCPKISDKDIFKETIESMKPVISNSHEIMILRK
ncbi:Hypothetical predicted protein [Octopus vulgaris]|uniref:Uncharacterized protein n=1 Tax=Octopus vulgaris TaxID=6645 RepID=A0AA36AU73_OCTVU|nr:Hypothetical predicted protein [Octopus vulgaris]